MENLILEGTEDTPSVVLDYSKAEFVFSGRSLPEDVNAFYQPVFEWLDRFEQSPIPSSSFQFKLEYFNTASSKVLLDILSRLESIRNDKSCDLKVHWYYMESDEDMQEAGEEYKELVELPFELIAY